MGQRRYIMSAVLILFFGFLLTGIFIKIPDWKTAESDAVEIKIDSYERRISLGEEEGKKLYSNKCMACHAGFDVDDGAYVMLAGLNDRWPDEQELIAYIKNSNDEKLKNSDNVRNSRARYSANYSNQDHEFKDLTDSQIQVILQYINREVYGRN